MKKQTVVTIFLLILTAALLSGCGSGAVSNVGNWPGLAADEDTVYLSNASYVYAVQGGQPLWQYPAEADRGMTFYAPVAIGEELIYVPTYNNRLAVVNKADGSLARMIEIGNSKNKVIATPLLTADSVIVLSSGGMVSAYPLTGSVEPLWQTSLSGEVWVKPSAEGDQLFVASMDKKMNVLNLTSGEKIAEYPLSGAAMSDPVCADGKLYFSTLAKEVDIFDTADSSISVLLNTTGEIWAAPLIMGEKLIAADMSGNLYCVDLNTRETLWTLTAVTAEGKGFIASPIAVGDDSFLVLSEAGDLMLYDLEGKSINTRSLASVVDSTPVRTADGSLIIAPLNSDAALKAFTADLKEDWVFAPVKEEKSEEKKEDK